MQSLDLELGIEEQEDELGELMYIHRPGLQTSQLMSCTCCYYFRGPNWYPKVSSTVSSSVELHFRCAEHQSRTSKSSGLHLSCSSYLRMPIGVFAVKLRFDGLIQCFAVECTLEVRVLPQRFKYQALSRVLRSKRFPSA